MLSIKLNKKIRIQKCKNNGLKFTLYFKGIKPIEFELSENELRLLKLIIKWFNK